MAAGQCLLVSSGSEGVCDLPESARAKREGYAGVCLRLQNLEMNSGVVTHDIIRQGGASWCSQA